MIDDSRNKSALGIAVASIGLSLAVLLAGICWVATQHGDITVFHERGCALGIPIHCRPESWTTTMTGASDIPNGLWFALVAFGAIFIAALIPLMPSRRGRG